MILSDLISLITDLSTDSEIVGRLGKAVNNAQKVRGKSSIKNRTKDLVLQYPLLASNSISSDTIHLTSRALENEYVNVLTVLLNSEIQTQFDKDEAKDTATFLKRYHTNIYRSGGAYQNESVSTNEIARANVELLESYDNVINLNILNKMSYPNSILKEAKDNSKSKMVDIMKNTQKNIAERDKKVSQKEREIEGREKNLKELEFKYKNNKLNGGAKINEKKLNDLSPTIVNATIKVKDGESVYDKDIQFGVKCVIHPLQSEDIVYYLSDSVRDNSKFFRLIQWTTGEIKFFRDLVASLDTVKRTAVNSKNKDTFWWRKLKSMAQDNLVRRLLNAVGKNSSTPIPTATLLISKQDVDAIKNKYSIDILNTPAHAGTIMKKFFLLGFVIVDEASQIAYLYNEVSKDFDYYTFNALKKAGKDETSDMDVTKSLMGGRR